jgi:hypothetical protein
MVKRQGQALGSISGGYLSCPFQTEFIASRSKQVQRRVVSPTTISLYLTYRNGTKDSASIDLPLP